MEEESDEDAARRAIMEQVGGFIVPMVQKPLIGAIACGEPIEAIQNADEFMDVPSSIHCDFYLRCKGDSMAPLIRDGEATLKHVRKRGDTVMLIPENPDFTPYVYTGENLSSLKIIGLAVGYTSLLN